MTIPAYSKKIAREIVRSWATPRSNFILVAPPLIAAATVFDLLLDENFYEECGLGVCVPAVARFRAGRIETQETFIKGVITQWDPHGEVSCDGVDIGSDLTKVLVHIISTGRVPVLIVEAFHEAIRALSWDMGTVLRYLEHEIHLKTVVELPVRLGTLKSRWSLEKDGVPFLASDFGQGHSTRVLGTYDQQESAQLVVASGFDPSVAETVYEFCGGIPELTLWLIQELRSCDSFDELQERVERGAYDVSHRFLKWLDTPGESTFTRILAKYVRPTDSAVSFASASDHEWKQMLLFPDSRLRSRVLGIACAAKLRELERHQARLLPNIAISGDGPLEPDSKLRFGAGSSVAGIDLDGNRQPVSLPTIVVAATCWGVRFGGINTFNLEFCTAMAAAVAGGTKVICLVPTEQSIIENVGDVTVLALRKNGSDDFIDVDIELALKVLSERNVYFVLGHDVKTGNFTNLLARRLNSRAVVFCHMAFEGYYTFTNPSEQAKRKSDQQRNVYMAADAVFAVGPKLYRHAQDLVRFSPTTVPVIEYLPNLLREQPIAVRRRIPCITFIGRLSETADIIKQGRLAITAIGTALARTDVEDPLVRVVGGTVTDEQAFREIIRAAYGRLVSVEVHPFTHSRAAVLEFIRDSSLVVMPSVHDGFGLVGWEAISLGIPLIISKNTGLHSHLREFGLLDFVGSVDVRGSLEQPHEDDVSSLAERIANKLTSPDQAHRDASMLVERLRNLEVYGVAKFTRDLAGLF